MDDKPKNRLSLKRTNQRKLDFKPKPQDDNKATVDVSDTNSSDGPPLSGLCNLGNTCYANSLLQTLRFCPALVERVGHLNEMVSEQQQSKDCKEEELPNGVVNGVMESSSNSECMMDCSESKPTTKKEVVTLSMHLYMLWQRMSQKEKTFVRTTNKVTTLTATRPDSFIAKLKEDHPMFDNKLQQDAQEMLRYLLTNLQETCMKVLLHSPKSTATKHLPSTPNKQDTNGRAVPVIIDVDSYHFTHENHPVIGSKRRAMDAKGGSKFAYKKLTDYYTPVKQQKLSQTKPPNDDKKTAASTQEGVHQTRHLDFIRGTFQGTLAYQMRCFECENYTRRTEEFLDVSVPVVSMSLPGFPACASPVKSSKQENVHINSSTVGPCSLSWALSQFALREKLRRDNKYFCDHCGHFVEAERSVLFSHLPSIVTVHLNRFTMQTWGLSSNITVNKVSGNIAVPLSLCLKPWCTNDCKNKERIFELFSVVFHSGTSCSSGHYTSCVRAKECASVAPSEAQIEQNQWVYFDDDLVEYLPQHKLLEMLSPLSNDSCTPYILFYSSTP